MTVEPFARFRTASAPANTFSTTQGEPEMTDGNRAISTLPAGQPELAAEIEVTKTIAFYALMASLRALEGDTRARIESFERAIKAFFSTYQADLPPEERIRFRNQAQVTIENLLSRVDIDKRPYKQHG
ncbi:MAG TPA: hypothetical protein VMU69_16850 [Bradyrhizobium sp.]|nr:hypothetical protein [Bradyrhizobium sp.]